MGKFDILDSGVPYSMDKTKNYVKLEDGSVEEIVDLSDLETTEVVFIGHKANIHKAELTDRNISVLDEKILTLKNNVYTKSEIATQISTAVNDLVDSAPGALDTLNELSLALGNYANFSTTVTNSIATKAPLNNPTFTGTVSGITKSMLEKVMLGVDGLDTW